MEKIKSISVSTLPPKKGELTINPEDGSIKTINNGSVLSLGNKIPIIEFEMNEEGTYANYFKVNGVSIEPTPFVMDGASIMIYKLPFNMLENPVICYNDSKNFKILTVFLLGYPINVGDTLDIQYVYTSLVDFAGIGNVELAIYSGKVLNFEAQTQNPNIDKDAYYFVSAYFTEASNVALNENTTENESQE